MKNDKLTRRDELLADYAGFACMVYVLIDQMKKTTERDRQWLLAHPLEKNSSKYWFMLGSAERGGNFIDSLEKIAKILQENLDK